ncbi:MAG: transposase [Solobacterium sp.]|nr:transposase [Solobacterium sp.]
MMDTELYTEYPYYGVLTCDDVNYDPDKPRIKDLLWKHYNWFVEMDRIGKARPCILDNVQKALLCNTFYMGYDVFGCPQCDNEMLFCRKCHSRFCTSCGVKYQKILALKAECMCVDTPHRHIVFTIPENYRLFFRKDRTALNLLFIAARNTICKITNEKIYRKEKRKRGKTGKLHNNKDNLYLYRNFKDAMVFGMIASIHTFGRDLKWNPHIHALVPEIIYDPVKDKIVHFHHFDFKNLRLTWQYEVNRLMQDHFGREFSHIKNDSYKQQENGFYVYAKYDKQDKDEKKDYSKDVAGCVNYMMRYASRPAMAQNRILSYNQKTDDVKWYYDDHKTEERIEVAETGLELLKKMIIHIPDEGFHTVRYYGFYHNKKKDQLERIYELMNQERKASRLKRQREQERRHKLRKARFRTSVCDDFNRDIIRCKCGAILTYEDSYNPLEGTTNDRAYRQECIDEMYQMWIHRKRAAEGPPAVKKNLQTQWS